MPELDTLRGLAILMVLFYHGFYFAHARDTLSGVARIAHWVTRPGWLGVNLFFVLSGFLITGILFSSKAKPCYYKNFYIRRALRILPAFYLMLLILGLARQSSWSFLMVSFFYLANLSSLFGVSLYYPVLWSLAVEEHFYLIWPAVVRKLSVGSVGLCALAIVLMTPVLRGLSFYFGHSTYFYTWFVGDGLACGALLATLVRAPRIDRNNSSAARWLCFVYRPV